MSRARRQALLSEIGEFQLIQSIARGFSRRGPQPVLGVGDDAAVLFSPAPHHLVISTDLLIEDIHFSRLTSSWYDIGYKAAVANLSDIAAMGASPTYILIAVALPASMTGHDWKELYRGLSVPCKAHDVQLVGGDTSASRSSLFLAVTILGHISPKRMLTRAGAQEGDVIYVSGTLGNSAAGLTYLQQSARRVDRSALRQPEKFLVGRHLRPHPQIALGRLLSSRRLASAALDISDGLSGDLLHLCRQSRVGARLRKADLPLSPQLLAYGVQRSVDPVSWALHGGEEYELLFTVPPHKQRRLDRAVRSLRLTATPIGVITAPRNGLQLIQENGQIQRIRPQSYDHFSG